MNLDKYDVLFVCGVVFGVVVFIMLATYAVALALVA